MTDHIMPTYARLPISFEQGEGAWLWDAQGNRYLDAIAGIAVCSLGHAHPAVREAICDQAGRLLHTSNLFNIEQQEQLARELARLSGLDNVFFCNSGAEANEAAIKIARAYGHARGIDNPAIVVMENSFHGRTLATLSATGNPRVQRGFEPLVEGFVRVPFDDIEALKSIHHPEIIAILVEPIQGEGGVRVPEAGYLRVLRQLCDHNEWLLMLDEIQTGIGRTGKFLAFQHEDIVPDVCTLAKGLGGGVPIGACLARGQAAAMLTVGKHGSTFGGNPLACRAALTVLKTLAEGNLIDHAARLGLRLKSALRERLQGTPQVKEIRGQGLMIGIELAVPCAPLVALALENHVLINVTAENTIRLLPPLVLEDDQADLLIETLCPLIAAFARTSPAV